MHPGYGGNQGGGAPNGAGDSSRLSTQSSAERSTHMFGMLPQQPQQQQLGSHLIGGHPFANGGALGGGSHLLPAGSQMGTPLFTAYPVVMQNIGADMMRQMSAADQMFQPFVMSQLSNQANAHRPGTSSPSPLSPASSMSSVASSRLQESFAGNNPTPLIPTRRSPEGTMQMSFVGQPLVPPYMPASGSDDAFKMVASVLSPRMGQSSRNVSTSPASSAFDASVPQRTHSSHVEGELSHYQASHVETSNDAWSSSSQVSSRISAPGTPRHIQRQAKAAPQPFPKSAPRRGSLKESKRDPLSDRSSVPVGGFVSASSSSKSIDEQFDALLDMMPADPEEIISMAKPHIVLEPDFLTTLGGVYKDLEDDTASIQAEIEKLQKALADMHALMGRNVPSKQGEPVKVSDNSIWEFILKEMQDFQDLVNYEHREKRRRFKAVIQAAQKQVSKFESRKLAVELEATKQQRLICKNLSAVVCTYWKKIERFAWERLKRDLQATLVEKKRMRLDKFVEDAIKLSITKNDKMRRGNKGRRIRSEGQSSTNDGAAPLRTSTISSDGKSSTKSEDTYIKKSAMNHVRMEDVSLVKREHCSDLKSEPSSYLSSVSPGKYGVKSESPKSQSLSIKLGSAVPADEDEFVPSEEMKKMERDDALLDMAMEREEDEQENGCGGENSKRLELNSLGDDLNVPIEEILRRYREEAEKFKEEHGSCTDSADYDGSYYSSDVTDDDRDNDEPAESYEGVDDQLASDEYSSYRRHGVSELPSGIAANRKRRAASVSSGSSSVAGRRFAANSPNLKRQDMEHDPEGEFTLCDPQFQQQEDEDMNLDEAMSDEHSDTETGKKERKIEISGLEDDANVPIEDLIARYRAAGGYDEEGYGDDYLDDEDDDDDVDRESMDEDGDDGVMRIPRKSASKANANVHEATDHESSNGTDSDDYGMADDSSTDEETQIQVPSLIRATLRPYQLEGLRWLASLYRKGSNGILADEMGLGKTLQTIALLAHLACDHGNWGPHLIVVPTSVLLNWEMEFKKFCPGFTILSYYGTPTERAKKRVGWNKPYSFNVCIASYATVVQDAYILKRKSWVYMVLDEAQNIKNFNSKRWQTLLTFNTEGRILLTGTPLQNSLQELWSLMHFILPEIFSSHSEFKEWFSDPLTESIEREQTSLDGKIKDSKTSDLVTKLHTVLRPYLLRRLKKDVEKQMPSKYEHVIKCYLSRRQRVLYDEFISSRSAVDALKNPNYRSMLFVLMQLRKICNHPDQLQSRPVESPFYDPMMMDDVFMPMLFTLPDTRMCGRLYRHVAVEIPIELPENLPITYGTFSATQRFPLPMSFMRSFKGSNVPVDRVYRESRNVYDLNMVRVPIVSRQLQAKCVLNDHSDIQSKMPVYRFLIEKALCTRAHEPLYHLRFDDYDPAPSDVTDESNPQPEGLGTTTDGSGHQESTSSSSVYHHGNNMEVDRSSAPGGQPSVSFASQAQHEVAAPPGGSTSIPDAQVEYTLQPSADDVNEGRVDQNGGSESFGRVPAGDQVYPYTRPLYRNSDVVVNRHELLEVDDTFLLHKLTIAKRPVAACDTFRPLVQPCVDDLVERHWWLISRFVCITGQRIECNPRRVFMTGRGGIAWNHRQDATISRVRSKLFRPSSFSYFKSTKYSIEHARGLQKLLFPPRSLLHDDCGKFLVLGRLLKRLKLEGHRCLLYTQFSKMLDILENWINYMGFTYVRLDGSTKVDMRQRIVTRFNENAKIFLFISSTRAGGVGLTLTGADTVIFYDTDWNPAMDRQAMDRCHRIGQTREVNVYRLVSEHTVEENIWRKQLQKRRLDDIVVDKGNFDSEHHNWFSNVDTLMTILKEQSGDGRGGPDDDIYGRKVLHESEAPPPDAAAGGRQGSSTKMMSMLAEAEDEADSAALLNRTKETETIDREFQMDFKADLVSSFPSLVAYCIQFMLKYKTPALLSQEEEMKIRIQAEAFDSAIEEDSGSGSGSGEDSEGGSEGFASANSDDAMEDE